MLIKSRFKNTFQHLTITFITSLEIIDQGSLSRETTLHYIKVVFTILYYYLLQVNGVGFEISLFVFPMPGQFSVL